MTDINTLNALGQSDFQQLTTDDIKNISSTSITALDLVHCGWLTAAQTAALSSKQVAAMSPAQLTAMTTLASLSTTATRGISVDAVRAMTPQQIGQLAHTDWLTPAAASGLSAEQVPCIAHGWGYFSADWLNALSPSAFAAIPPARMSSLPTASINGLNAAAVGAMTADQIATFTKLDNLSAAWLNALSPQAVAALSASVIATVSASAIPGLSPATLAAMSAAQVAAVPSPELLSPEAATVRALALGPTDWSTATAAWLNDQTPLTLATITAAQISQLSASVIPGLSAATVAALTPDQIAALPGIDTLSLAAVAGLRADQVPFVSRGWKYMSADWLNALSPEAFAAVSVSNVGTFSSAAIAGLSGDAVRAMSPQQIAALSAPVKLASAAVAALNPAQITALASKLSGVSANWINALSPQAIGALRTSSLSTSVIAGLTATTLGAMSRDQLAVLTTPAQLSPEAAAVRNAALGPWAAVTWSQVTADWLNVQSAADLSTLPAGGIGLLPSATVQALSANTIAALSPLQIAGLTSPQLLAPAAVAALSADQVGAIRNGWGSVGAAWLNVLSPAAIAAIPTTAMAQLSGSALAGLGTATVAAMSPAQLTAVTKLASLGTGTKGISAAVVSAMTPDQIAQLGHPDVLNPIAVGALSAAQVQRVSIAWSWMSATWLNALAPDAFAAIPAAQMDTLSNASIQGLDAAHVRAMTLAQITSFTKISYLSAAGTQGLTADEMKALTSQQIASLSYAESLTPAAVSVLGAAQVAAIGASAWSKVNGAWLGALSADAISAIPLVACGKFGAPALRGLTSDNVQGLTAQQFGALANPEWIPLSAVARIRPDQLSLMTDMDSVSARWFNALSPEAFAAIPASGINQMSLAALQGLDATHRAIALTSADAIHAGYIVTASSDASLNYDSVLANLSQMRSGIGADGLSVDQLAAFNGMLSGAKAADGEQTYVSSLLTSVLKDGLQVTTSADAFAASVNKWFLGTNNPTVKAGGGYADLSDKALFNGSIQQASVGVAQGSIGDCWLISSLEELATLAPERLSGLIGDNGNGTYAVKFYNGKNPFFVTVDSVVANYGASTSAGSWVRLIEDAYVEAASSGCFSANGYGTVANDYGFLSGGTNGKAQQALVGNGYKTYSSGAAAYDAVAAALKDGSSLVTYSSFKSATTGADGKTNLVSSHAFSVVGIDEANKEFIFRNPWSSDLVFEMTAAELDSATGSGYFSVTKMQTEYGAAALANPPAQAQAQAQGDAANLVQAMASFDLPTAAVTAGNATGKAQLPEVTLLASHAA